MGRFEELVVEDGYGACIGDSSRAADAASVGERSLCLTANVIGPEHEFGEEAFSITLEAENRFVGCEREEASTYRVCYDRVELERAATP